MHDPELMAKIRKAPMQCGCYLYRDSMGNVIYVGKSKLLKNRVRQYFQKRREDDSPKLDNLVRAIADVEYQITPTERDALMLEYRLIKQYKPWFNAQLVAAPKQLYLRIGRTALPTLTIAEQVAEDGADYVGYFHDRYDAQDALLLLNQVWHVPLCGKASFETPTRPCVQHEVGRCLAPCGQSGEASIYQSAINEILQLLRGQRPPVFSRLEAAMKGHATQMNLEKAAAIKHQMDQLDRLRKRSRSMASFPEKGDVLVFLRAYREVGFTLFLVRDAAIAARLDVTDDLDPATLLDRISRSPAPQDSDWLPGCLIELYADKLFVPLPVDANQQVIHQIVSEAYHRFASRDHAGTDWSSQRNQTISVSSPTNAEVHAINGREIEEIHDDITADH